MRRFRIGRSETNEIVVTDASVSRQHAEVVELGGGRFTISDLGSTYGTHVLQNDNWVPAAGTEIGAETAIRLGDYRTTLGDLLPKADAPSSAPGAAREGLRIESPGDAPVIASPPPRPPAAARAPGMRRAATTGRRSRYAPSRQRQALVLGMAGLGGFFVVAIAVILWVLMAGDSGEPRRPSREAGGGAERILAACTSQWGIEDQRCRCFLAAAGANLQSEDYEDFAGVLEAYVAGEAERAETLMQAVAERRGQPASSRMAAALARLARDCPQ